MNWKRSISGLLFLLPCIILSCNHSGKSGNDVNNISKSATYDTLSLDSYRIYLRSLDTLHPESTTSAAKKYADLFKGSNQGTRDLAFSVFKDFYNKIDQSLDNNRDAAISYDSLVTDSNGNLPKLSPRLTTYAQTLSDNGFKVIMSEGNPYIGQDLDFEVKWFYAYLSEPLKAFLTQQNKEGKEGFSEDAGLIISPEQLTDRTVWWENFSKKYTQSIVARPAMENWKSYLGTMMTGMDNSPVMAAGNAQSISPYFKAAYSRVLGKYPATETAKLIGPYFKLLIDKDAAKARQLVKDYEEKKIIY